MGASGMCTQVEERCTVFASSGHPSDAHNSVDVPHAWLPQTQMRWEQHWLLSHGQCLPLSALNNDTICCGFESCLANSVGLEINVMLTSSTTLSSPFAAAWLVCPVWSYQSKMSTEAS